MNGWTGGQASLARVFLAAVLLAGLLGRLHPFEGERAWALGLGLALVPLLALGLLPRSTAVAAALAWAFSALPGRPEPLRLAEAALLVALGVQALLPPAPYGSLSARGRPDPGGGWRFPPGALRFAQTALLTGLFLDALLRVTGWLPHDAWAERMRIGFELGTVFASARRALRPFALGVMALGLGVHAGAGAPAALLWLPLLALAFDPAWIPPHRPFRRPDILFYDGHCGLCHRFVRFLLAEDPAGTAFRFAPLQGATFSERVDDEARPQLPDSVVLLRADGALLTRSDAAAWALGSLGGFWRLLGHVLIAVPRPLRDGAYDLVARLRSRLFRPPPDLCPVLPPHLADRFLA